MTKHHSLSEAACSSPDRGQPWRQADVEWSHVLEKQINPDRCAASKKKRERDKREKAAGNSWAWKCSGRMLINNKLQFLECPALRPPPPGSLGFACRSCCQKTLLKNCFPAQVVTSPCSTPPYSNPVIQGQFCTWIHHA